MGYKKGDRQPNSLIVPAYLFTKKDTLMFSGASDSVRSPRNNFKNNLNLNGIAWHVLPRWRSQSNSILAAHPKTAGSWDCVLSCTVYPEKLHHQSSLCVKQYRPCTGKYLTIAFSLGKNWLMWSLQLCWTLVAWDSLYTWNRHHTYQNYVALLRMLNFLAAFKVTIFSLPVQLSFPPLPCLSEATELTPELHCLHYYIALFLPNLAAFWLYWLIKTDY